MNRHLHKKLRLATLLVLASALTSAPALSNERQLDSHEHGVSSLKIAQEGNTISFELEAPGDDIVGFEYAPKSEAEKAAVKAALAKFTEPEALFAISSEAGCTVTKKDAEFETSKDHAGFHVTWSLNCKMVGKAQSMQVDFFNAFSKAKEVEVAAVGSAGQMSAEVEKDASTVDLSKAIGL